MSTTTGHNSEPQSHQLPGVDWSWLGHWLTGRDTGSSSLALAASLLTGLPPAAYPYDHGDLGRCERMYDLATLDAQDAMRDTLVRWQNDVWAKYPTRMCPDCRGKYFPSGRVPDEAGEKWTTCGRCSGAGELTREPFYAVA